MKIDLKIDMKDLEKDFGSLTNLCRDLVKKGVHPNSTVTIMRDEIVAIKTKDIYKTAKWTVRENASAGPVFVKYEPFDEKAKARLANRRANKASGSAH